MAKLYDYNGKDDGTVCMMPWVFTTVTMKNTIRPCCAFNLDNAVDIKEIKPGIIEDSFKWLRKDMLAGKKAEACKSCYENEKFTPPGDIQPKSMRGQANTDYRLDLQNLDEEFIGLKGIELSLDNICNLQCKMCDSMFSSKLYARDQHLIDIGIQSRKPTKVPKQRIEFIKALGVDWTALEHIKILGGEPFFSPNFEKLVDHLLEEGTPDNLVLEIVSNCTNKIDTRIIDKLNLFKEVILTCSLDGINDYNSYQRWGSPGWEETLGIYEWYQIMLTNTKKRHVHSTYSLLNINGFAADAKWFALNEPEYRVSFQFVKEGDQSPYIAPPMYIDWLIEQWESEMDTDDWPGGDCTARVENAIAKLETFNHHHKNHGGDWRDFCQKIPALDKYYDSKLVDYNPDLHEYLMSDPQYEV